MLTDKIVLVTGAGSGIGRATAQVLATYGAIVIAADIDDKQANATAALIQKAGGQSDAEHVDVANEGEVDSLIQNILARHGRLDGAFNNAGIEGPTAKVLDVTVKEWERVQRVNLTGVFMCIKREIEQMVTQDTGGAIVSTASVAGLVAIPGAGS